MGVILAYFLQFVIFILIYVQKVYVIFFMHELLLAKHRDLHMREISYYDWLSFNK